MRNAFFTSLFFFALALGACDQAADTTPQSESGDVADNNQPATDETATTPAPEEEQVAHTGCPTHIHIDDLPYGPEGQAIADRVRSRLCAPGTGGRRLDGIEEGHAWTADWDPPPAR